MWTMLAENITDLYSGQGRKFSDAEPDRVDEKRGDSTAGIPSWTSRCHNRRDCSPVSVEDTL